MALVILRSRVRRFRLLRHVSSGFTRPGMTWSEPVMGDGEDAARHPEIVAAPDGARLDRALDLVEAGLDGLGFREQLLGPVLVLGFPQVTLTPNSGTGWFFTYAA